MDAILKILMSSIVCNNTQCKYNGGKFCNKSILIIYGGVCGELVDSPGRQRDPASWQKTNLSNGFYNKEQWEADFNEAKTD